MPCSDIEGSQEFHIVQSTISSPCNHDFSLRKAIPHSTPQPGSASETKIRLVDVFSKETSVLRVQRCQLSSFDTNLSLSTLKSEIFCGICFVQMISSQNGLIKVLLQQKTAKIPPTSSKIPLRSMYCVNW